jgi:hypothetical protein
MSLAYKWNLYYHLPFDKNWDAPSYKLIMNNIETVEQAISINETLPNEIIYSCMLFVMKVGIMPLWEDKANRNGGAFSYKVYNTHVPLVWRRLFYLLCGNTLLVDKTQASKVNGISISPKKGFCIIKIWFVDCSIQNPESVVAIPELQAEGCLFKKHEPEF